MACRLGVVALGDSITNGHGGMQAMLGSQSWAHWLAQALDLPFLKLATDGAIAPGVAIEQVPRLGDRRFALGTIYVGVNDVRNLDWDPDLYERSLRAILGPLAAACDRTLTVTIPLAVGLPPAGPKVPEANAVIERIAAEHGTVVCDLRDLDDRRLVWADRVHLTATGQVHVADRAARALREAGMTVPVLPSQLAAPPADTRSYLAYYGHYARRAVRERLRVAAETRSLPRW
jgi:lysophospholipase L1-like esterase